MLVLTILSPKTHGKLNLFTNKFESVWVSLKTSTCVSSLVIVTYSSDKQNSNAILDQLANNIHKTITKNGTKQINFWLIMTLTF